MQRKFFLPLCALLLGGVVGFFAGLYASHASYEGCVLNTVSKSEPGYAVLISRACREKFPEDFSGWNDPFN